MDFQNLIVQLDSPKWFDLDNCNNILHTCSTKIINLSIFKATNDNRLKGGVSMLPWHAIPFQKGLGMPNANPCENG